MSLLLWSSDICKRGIHGAIFVPLLLSQNQLFHTYTVFDKSTFSQRPMLKRSRGLHRLVHSRKTQTHGAHSWYQVNSHVSMIPYIVRCFGLLVLKGLILEAMPKDWGVSRALCMDCQCHWRLGHKSNLWIFSCFQKKKQGKMNGSCLSFVQTGTVVNGRAAT